MAVTLDTIVTAARDRHPAFDVRRTPSALLVRYLSGYQKLLQGKALQRNRRALLASQTTSLPLADFAAGITLPANVYVEGGVVTNATDATQQLPLLIVDASIRLRVPVGMLAAWLDGLTKLKLTGTANGWLSWGSVTVDYVPACAPLTKLSDTIVLPDDTEQVFVEQAAAFMYARSHKDPNLPAISLAEITLSRKMADRTEADWLDSLGARRVGQAFQIQDGF